MELVNFTATNRYLLLGFAAVRVVTIWNVIFNPFLVLLLLHLLKGLVLGPLVRPLLCVDRPLHVVHALGLSLIDELDDRDDADEDDEGEDHDEVVPVEAID